MKSRGIFLIGRRIMSFIVRHKRLGRKLADIFSDRRVSGFQLARDSVNEMDNIAVAVANEWVNALNELQLYDQPIEFEPDGSVKLPNFPV